MVLDERARHNLFLRLEAVLGPAEASTLMEHLPPTGWADVATRRDLDALEERMNLRFEHLDLRFEALEYKLQATFRGELHSAITAQTKTLAFTLAATMLTSSGLAFAAARLSG